MLYTDLIIKCIIILLLVYINPSNGYAQSYGKNNFESSDVDIKVDSAKGRKDLGIKNRKSQHVAILTTFSLNDSIIMNDEFINKLIVKYKFHKVGTSGIAGRLLLRGTRNVFGKYYLVLKLQTIDMFNRKIRLKRVKHEKKKKSLNYLTIVNRSKNEIRLIYEKR